MSRTIGNSLVAPTFLVANSPEKLHDLMLKTNLEWRSEFNYFSIYESKGKHYAWFYFDHKLLRNREVQNDG